MHTKQGTTLFGGVQRVASPQGALKEIRMMFGSLRKLKFIQNDRNNNLLLKLLGYRKRIPHFIMKSNVKNSS